MGNGKGDGRGWLMVVKPKLGETSKGTEVSL